MTPLAFELLKDLTDRRKPFTPLTGEREMFWTIVTESKFFDMRAVGPLVQDLAAKMRRDYERRDLFSKRLAFLPAYTAWLEFDDTISRVASTVQRAIVLRGRKQSCTNTALVYNVYRGIHDRTVKPAATDRIPIRPCNEGGWCFGTLDVEEIPLVDSPELPAKRPLLDHVTHELGEVPRASREQFEIYAALALINSPRIIGRRQHMPHERIERDKLKALGLVGKFPLHAWTEIILKVAPPDLRTGEPSNEAHLTGERCLHFVRTFLRVRMGQLEYVDAHWRGNPALGMKRSRYRLEEGTPH